MLYLLAQWLHFAGAANLIRYQTFRSGAALMTALTIGLVIGPRFITMLRSKQGRGQPIREDGGSKRGSKGYDAGKKVKGRKRHLAVDTIGLPIECQITTADVQDRDALAPLLKEVHRKSPWVKMSFVDGGYQGDEAQRAAFEASRISITVVKRTDKDVKGFVVLPKRWVVERTFGWINRARRLSKDFEATIESALAWLQLALAFLLMRRLARANARQI